MYHVMQRGIRRKEIFSNDNDYYVFLKILSKEMERYQCKIHAYCLMTNHYHLLVETSEYEIWKFMRGLSHKYAQYFNSINSFQGHLFEGRYKSRFIQEDAYFLQTGRYIHLNPVKAGIVEYPEDYPWSSYRTMLGIGDDRITQTDRTLIYFGKNPTMCYRQFVEDAVHKYVIEGNQMTRSKKEEELWLPW